MPGFEPGSTDRESVMMDRTTPHERYLGECPSLFENDAIVSKQFSLSLSPAPPFPSLILESLRHLLMKARQNNAEIIFRKRPEPHRVVSLSTLKVSGQLQNYINNGPIVNHKGKISASESWKPIQKKPTPIEVSPSGWNGLHHRMLSSLCARVEVA